MISAATDVTARSISAIREAEAQGLAQGRSLMLVAGTSAARFIQDKLAPASNIVVLVGPGNNGGDALVAARALLQLGHQVTAVMPVASPGASADASEALMNWQVAGGTVKPDLPGTKPAAIIDGLFGIGLSRTLGEPWQTVIQAVNDWQVPVLALDIASGLNADTGQSLGEPIQARWTLSFIAPSFGVMSEQGKQFCGQCFVDDLDLKS